MFLEKKNFMHLKNVQKLSKSGQWVRKILYFENIKTKLNFFVKKVIKMGTKSKRIYFQRSFPITPSEKIPPASLLWNQASTVVLGLKVKRRRSKIFFQMVFKGTKNHTRAVKLLVIINNYANFDLILGKIEIFFNKVLQKLKNLHGDILSTRDILLGAHCMRGWGRGYCTDETE